MFFGSESIDNNHKRKRRGPRNDDDDMDYGCGEDTTPATMSLEQQEGQLQLQYEQYQQEKIKKHRHRSENSSSSSLQYTSSSSSTVAWRPAPTAPQISPFLTPYQQRQVSKIDTVRPFACQKAPPVVPSSSSLVGISPLSSPSPSALFRGPFFPPTASPSSSSPAVSHPLPVPASTTTTGPNCLTASDDDSRSRNDGPNQHLISELTRLQQVYAATGDKWREYAYSKALTIIKKYDTPIQSAQELRLNKHRGIGEKLILKIDEILSTGTSVKLQLLSQSEQVKVMQLFSGIWGVGPTVAKRLYLQGFRTLQDLENNQISVVNRVSVGNRVSGHDSNYHVDEDDSKDDGDGLVKGGSSVVAPAITTGTSPVVEKQEKDPNLTSAQKIGLKHYHDLTQRIPRVEVEAIQSVVVSALQALGIPTRLGIFDQVDDEDHHNNHNDDENDDYTRGEQRLDGDRNKEEKERGSSSSSLVFPSSSSSVRTGTSAQLGGISSTLDPTHHRRRHHRPPERSPRLIDVVTCGSYRRGKSSCGDVDILLCDRMGRQDVDGVLRRLVTKLKSDCIAHCFPAVTTTTTARDATTPCINNRTGSDLSAAVPDASSVATRVNTTAPPPIAWTSPPLDTTAVSPSYFSVMDELTRSSHHHHHHQQQPLSSTGTSSNSPQYCDTWFGVVMLPACNDPSTCPFAHATDGKTGKLRHIARRLDLKAYAAATFPFAVFYFTGSGYFNRSVRLYAHHKGFSLSDKDLRPVIRDSKGKEVIHEGLPVSCRTERDIFAALGLPYKAPAERDIS